MGLCLKKYLFFRPEMYLFESHTLGNATKNKIKEKNTCLDSRP